MTTLWFFWPIILALYRGSSARRAYVSVGIAAAMIALPLRIYFDVLAAAVFTPDTMNSFSPYYVVPYAISYARGWVEAKKHAGDETILLEGYGMGGHGTPGAPPFSSEALKKYHIEINPVAACVVNPSIQGHAGGYNSASVAEIKRRYGANVIVTAEQEEARRQERFKAAMDAGRADAEADLRSGRFVLEVFAAQPGSARDYDPTCLEEYKVELRHVANGVDPVGDEVLGHAQGNNEVLMAEIQRRFGQEAWKVIFEAQGHYSCIRTFD
jgi:hypothetical protein